MISSRSKIITICSLVLLAGAAGGLYAYDVATRSPGAGAGEYKYITDFDVDKNVVGFADNIFVAKITRFVEHTYAQGVLPVSVFEAEVLQNIKGDKQGTVRVVQQKYYYENENGRLMEPGETYVLAVRCEGLGENDVPDACIINSHRNGSKLLSKDGKKSKEELVEIAESDKKVKALKEAAKK